MTQVDNKNLNLDLIRQTVMFRIAFSFEDLGVVGKDSARIAYMKILGIDPGLAIVGFGLIEVEKPASPKLLEFGTIVTPKQTPIGDRLKTIYEDMHTLIEQFQPQVVGMEKLFFYRMGNLVNVAQARGVIVLVLNQHNIEPIEFSPPQIKQALTGHGNADKSDVQEAVKRELSLDVIPRPDDAADAIAAALTCWLIA